MKSESIKKYGVVYKIQNKVNNKVYIGQTSDEQGFDGRYNGDLERYTHNIHLKSSIKKYGIENFEIIKELEVAYSQEELNEKEIYWIEHYDSTNPMFGYNKREGGEGGSLNEESKIKISETKQINRENIVKTLLNKLKENPKDMSLEENDSNNDCLVNIPIDLLLNENEKLFLIYIYLYVNTNKFGLSCFNLTDLISHCGYSLDSHKSRSCTQFKEALMILKENKYIDCSMDLNKIKPNDFVKCILNLNYNTFSKIYYSDIIKLNDLNIKENKSKLLKTYIYLINFCTGIHSLINNNQISLSKTLNMSEGSFSNYVKILNKNNFIFSENIEYITTSLGCIKGGMLYTNNKNDILNIKKVVNYIEI